jgi:hypothetical protein
MCGWLPSVTVMEKPLCSIRVLVKTHRKGAPFSHERQIAHICQDSVKLGETVIPLENISNLKAGNQSIEVQQEDKLLVIQAEGFLEFGYADKDMTNCLVSLVRSLGLHDSDAVARCLISIQKIRRRKRFIVLIIVTSVVIPAIALLWVDKWTALTTVAVTGSYVLLIVALIGVLQSPSKGRPSRHEPKELTEQSRTCSNNQKRP